MREELKGYAFFASLAIHILLFGKLIPLPDFPMLQKEKDVWIDIDLQQTVPIVEEPPRFLSLPMAQGIKPPNPPFPLNPEEPFQGMQRRRPKPKVAKVEKPNVLSAGVTAASKDPTLFSEPAVSPEPLPMRPFPEADAAREKAVEKEIQSDQLPEPVHSETPGGTFPSANPHEVSPARGEPELLPGDEETAPSPAVEMEKKAVKKPVESRGSMNQSPDPPTLKEVSSLADAPSLFAYTAMIRKKIAANKRYPSWARRNGWQGRVVLDFVISRDGHLKEVRVVMSSGYRILDEAAREAIERANPYPPLPVKEKDFLELRLPMVFRLEG